jgi:hypothetical protein
MTPDGLEQPVTIYVGSGITTGRKFRGQYSAIEGIERGSKDLISGHHGVLARSVSAVSTGRLS